MLTLTFNWTQHLLWVMSEKTNQQFPTINGNTFAKSQQIVTDVIIYAVNCTK